MDWKREAMDKLRCYEAKAHSFELSKNELRRLEMEMTSIRSASADGTAVHGGGSGREDAMINNIVRREELKHAMSEARLWVKSVEGALSVLDKDERHILDMFYIHRARGNVDRLCCELHVEKATVYRRKDSALRHFTLALYGAVET